MSQDLENARELHKDVPPDWYYTSIRENVFQSYWHKRRFEEIGKMTTPVDGKVLDIGCADGVFTKVILDETNAKKIVGIDVLQTSIDWAKKHWKRNKKMDYIVADVHDLPFKAKTFDAVFALEMLEHIYNPKKALEEISRVLKNKGYAMFLVPTDNFLFRIIWFLWGFSGRMVWEDTHIQSYQRNKLSKLARKCGFSVVAEKKFLLGMLYAVKVRKI